METKVKRVVLIVEDDPRLQKAMIAELGRMDFNAFGALHYDAAIDLLARRRPHLVCIDLELPTQSGYDLCEHIRGPLGLTRVPILVTSESGLPKDMANAEEVGANAFLKKPFSMRQLAAYVEALLAKIKKSEPYLRRLEL
jgi:DNA-binding response OmpR family regulator